MARWQEIVAAEPSFAREVRARFDAHKHKTLATLRNDGSPRISGIEATFTDDEVWLGAMPGSVKSKDLLRDPRFALHSASVDPPEDDPSGWSGDAKLAGQAVAVTDAAQRQRASAAMGAGDQPDSDLPIFRLDIREAVLTRVGDPPDHLLIEFWQAGKGRRTVKRT